MANIQNDPFTQNAWNAYLGNAPKGVNTNDQGLQQHFGDVFGALKGQFGSMFQNLVGRAPTADELNTFSSQFVAPHISNLTNNSDPYNQNTGDYVRQFVGDTYQGAAKDFATQQLTAQQGQANQLSDMFRTQGRQAISDTEKGLLDYQQQLFDRLRPSLITSLQSQGLLNTGGMNEAIAGAQKDLATSAQGSLLDARLANEQQANAIQYGGAAAPYQYQQSQIMNQVPYMQQQAQGAMNNNYSTFLNNLDYSHQLGLQNNMAKLQADAQPGLLGRLGQNFTSSLGSTWGQGAGNATGSLIAGPTWSSASSQKISPAAVAAMG